MEKAVMIAMSLWFAIGAFGVVANIGKPRKPITHGMAIFGMIVAILLMLGTSYLGGVIFQ